MFTIFGFYKFKKIRLLKRYKSLFQEEISKNNIKGTIILSTEGINGSIAGKKHNINKIIKTLKKKFRFNVFDSKNFSKSRFQPFHKGKIKIKNDSGSLKIDGREFYKTIDENNLSGSWLMSGIERRGEMRMRDVNRPRKTLKMLAGGRFQWIAYDTSKKGFYGTGGGTFTAVEGKYIENIEFFSRDSNTVGKSLEFNYEIKEGDWHHKGFSSKGDPKYEIWTKRKQ